MNNPEKDIDAYPIGIMSDKTQKEMTDFAENLVLVEAYNDKPEIKGNVNERIYFAIMDVLLSIWTYQRGESKNIREISRQDEEDYIEAIKFISERPNIIHRLGFLDDAWEHHQRYLEQGRGQGRRTNINDRTLIKDKVFTLYLILDDYPNSWEDREMADIYREEDGRCPYIISKEAQVSIVYQIYKFAGLDNSYDIKYGDVEKYPELRALDSIARERQRLFRSAKP